MDFQHKINYLKAQPASYWIGLANTRLPEMVSGALLLLIAYYLARFFWALVPMQQEFDWTIQPASGNRPAMAANQVNYRTIVDAHLFGEAGAEPIINTTAIDAPETRLNLKLRGVVAAEDDSLSHAIIADGKGNDNVYFLNDSVPGGAKLYEVYPDRVILNRSGSLETLTLPKTSEKGSSSTRTASSRPTTTPPANNGGSVSQLMPDGPASFTDVLRPQPYMPNGQLKGYRVYPGRDRRRFSALGLRPGDLVTDINGQPLNNLQSGMDVFRSLGNATQITVTIERNGSPMSLTLDTNQLANSAGNTQ